MKNSYVSNSLWIILGRIIQVLLGIIVGIISARYLGPSNFGLINYASAYVAFFTPIANLGIDSTIINVLLRHPDKQGKIIGTVSVMKSLSSIVCISMISLIVVLVDPGETITFIVSVLCSLKLLFQSFQTFQFWYQSRLESKKNVFAQTIAYIVMSVYKIMLLIFGMSVQWFAFAVSLDMLISSIGMWIMYRYDNGAKLTFNLNLAKEIIAESHHFIIAGIIATVYTKIDTVMIKQMMSDTACGLYSCAYSLANYWSVICAAIIESARPAIINASRKGVDIYEKRNKQLYAIIIWSGIAVSILFTLLSSLIINILYGAEYTGAINSLKILAWFETFTQLGSARTIWLICEKKQKYVKYFSVIGVIINITLNALLIPRIGIAGAAIATLMTEIFTGCVVSAFFKETRRASVMMLEAFLLKNVNLKSFMSKFKINL